MGLKNPIAVYTADSLATAYIVKQYLDSAGIEAFVSERSRVRGVPPSNLRGIYHPEIFVEKSDAKEAWLLLKEFEHKKRKCNPALKENEPKTIEVLCEECGEKSYFASSLEGTCQHCSHCDEFVDVGEIEWSQDVESEDDTEDSIRPSPTAELMGEEQEKTGWLGIPIILNHEEFLAIEEHFIRLGIEYQSKTMETRTSLVSSTLHHSFFVLGTHASAAAIVLRNILDIDDPATEQPFHGSCPACGENVNGAWACPSCEINFRGGYDKDDEIIEFLRRYGGFEET